MCLRFDHETSIRCRQVILDRSRFFRGLPEAIIGHVATHGIERHLDDGEALFFKHDSGDFIALVIRGQIYTMLYGPDGQELIVDTIGPGETVGETALVDPLRRNFTAIAYGPTCVLMLARRHFPTLMSEPAFVDRALSTLCARLRKAAESLETMCLHRLESRLARYFLSLARVPARIAPGGIEVALPPTQSILAAMVNVSRPKLNAQLQTWHRAGLISRKRNVLRINDVDQLRRKAYLGRGHPPSWPTPQPEAGKSPRPDVRQSSTVLEAGLSGFESLAGACIGAE